MSQFKFGGQFTSWGATQVRLRSTLGSRGPVRSAKIRLRGIFWTFWQLRAHIHMVSMSATKLIVLPLNC